MGNRTIYNPSVEVHARHLQNTETQRIESDKRIVSDATTRGVAAGLVVTVGTPATTINIAAGSAYSPNGEYMQLITAQFGVALADYVSGHKNYVVLIYDESLSNPEAREFDGTTANTKATVAPRLVVLTETAYNALPSTDPVLANNAQDRACLVAVVTANGSGVDLTPASIQSPTSYGVTLQVSPTTLLNITGVTVTAIDSNVSTGVGYVRYDATSTSIQWRSPTDSYGPLVNILALGSYTLTSSSGYTLTISHSSSLPLAGRTDTITITSLYSQSIPRHTAEDFQHRSMLGTGVATLHNPHGLTIADIGGSGGGSVIDHQDIMHANGIYSGSAASTLQVTVNTSSAFDTITINGFSGSSRAYIKGMMVNNITPTVISWADITTNTQSLWGIYLDYTGVASKQLRAQYPVGSTLTNITQIVDIVGISGTFRLVQASSKYHIAVGGVSGPEITIPVYNTVLRLYDASGVNYVDVFVKGGEVLAANEEITVSPEPSSEEYLPLCNLPYTGVIGGGGGDHGSLGYGFDDEYSAPNRVYDRRSFGNLDISNTSTYAGIINSAEMVTDLLGNGICLNTHITPGSTDGEVSVSAAYTQQFKFDGASTITGGTVYLAGHKLEVLTTAMLLADGVNKVYIDSTGAMCSSTSTWPVIISLQYNKPIVRLYEITVSGGLVTLTTDIREFVGQKRNVPMGVVGLDTSAAAEVRSTGTGSAVSIHGWSTSSTGIGVKGTTALGYGVWGYSSSGGRGVYGESSGGNAIEARSTSGAGIFSRSTDGYGAWLVGNATRAPLLLDGLSSAPTDSNEGQVYYDSSTHSLYFRNATSWVDVAAGVPDASHTVSGIINLSDQYLGAGIKTVDALVAYNTLSASGRGATGILGSDTGLPSMPAGVLGYANSATPIGTALCGVYGSNVRADTTSNNYGVYGECISAGAGARVGVYGNGAQYGVHGNGDFTPSSIGVYGFGQSNHGVQGVAGDIPTAAIYDVAGILGCSLNRRGVLGASTNSYGVEGRSANSVGVYSEGTTGTYGKGGTFGVEGESVTGYGVVGLSSGYASPSSGSDIGVYGAGDIGGILGVCNGSGSSHYGVRGYATGGAAPGIVGESTNGPGGKFIGNISRAPINLLPWYNDKSSLPTTATTGDMCWTLGYNSVGDGNPTLFIYTGASLGWRGASLNLTA